MIKTRTSATTLTLVDGESVYPCRCGETHTGLYAIYDYMHHNCLHDGPLVYYLREVEPESNEVMCEACGKTWQVEEE